MDFREGNANHKPQGGEGMRLSALPYTHTLLTMARPLPAIAVYWVGC
jgi:hypothetical protein